MTRLHLPLAVAPPPPKFAGTKSISPDGQDIITSEPKKKEWPQQDNTAADHVAAEGITPITACTKQAANDIKVALHMANIVGEYSGDALRVIIIPVDVLITLASCGVLKTYQKNDEDVPTLFGSETNQFCFFGQMARAYTEAACCTAGAIVGTVAGSTHGLFNLIACREPSLTNDPEQTAKACLSCS